MKLYTEKELYKLYHGNMLDMLEVIEPNTIDSIVCDPPYELNFMGKGWDNSGIAFNKDAWKKCYEVLKPGAYLLAFGGSRTYHRIACAIEDAGFEIRDCIMYLYGSGFPKSHNIGLSIDKRLGNKSKIIDSYERYNEPSGIVSIGQGERKKVIHEVKKAQNDWDGWGTALKPAYEPIIVARKPFKTSVAENTMKYGVGGINIDECRIEFVGNENTLRPLGNSCYQKGNKIVNGGEITGTHELYSETGGNADKGRFPANVIHDGSEEAIKDMPNTKGQEGVRTLLTSNIYGGNSFNKSNTKGTGEISGYSDEGSASRYFYCAKASKKDRDEGLDMFESKQKIFNGKSNQSSTDIKDVEERFTTIGKNIHPTVKPVELMQYLVRLVTPKNGTILDCFMGSGSTGKATMFENRERNANYKFIGIELTDEYLPICEARIEYAINKYEYDFVKELDEAKAEGQQNIFDMIGVDKI